MTYTHNSNPEYYNTHPGDSNCGSFAFNLKEWYNPEEYVADQLGCFYIDEIEYEFLALLDNGYTENDIVELYTGWIAESVIEDLGDEVRYVNPEDKLDDNEELVCLRTFVCIYDNNWCNHDFHFRVLRDGLWMEKCGGRPVTFCDINDWNEYDSEIVYFAHRVA